MLTLKEFKEARGVLSGVIRNTSLVYSPAFSKATGNQIYIKPENMQVTGAYKIRGAYYKISTLSDEEKARGLVTASAGNHAQGVAYAAQAAGVSATIVMPTTTPLVKVNNTKDYGAKVVLHGETFDDAAELAAKLSEEEGLTYVHPFNDPAIATGQGTISYEIFQDLPDVDVILVPIGGGGLATGVSTLAKLLNPNVTVIGVEPSGAASMKASLDAGHVVTLDRVETIADGVAVKTPGDQIFPYIQKNIDDIITIPDDELVDAFLDMMEKHKMIVENAGLLPIAALSHLKCRGKNVVPVLSGGNMDVITVASLVQHGLINRGRVFTFSVQLPDRPGELLRVAQLVAEANVDKIAEVLEGHQVTLMKDIAMLDQMYELNTKYYKELTMYILAGKKRLNQVRANELEQLRQKAAQSGTQEDAQAYNDLTNMCSRFEKKLHDLELTRMISIQMGPQTRLIQNNDTLMLEKIQSSLVNTIPLWKSQMVLSLGLEHSRQATAAQSAVTNMTNELLKKNADMLKMGTIETAREAERSVVDIQTLQHTNEQLISTLDEVMNIQREGAQKRREAEAELGRIEGQLKQKLLELRG